MLSRIAESLFWIGRYVERVDGTARLVDVVRLARLEDPTQEEEMTVRLVLSVIMGHEDLPADIGFDDLWNRLVVDVDAPSSITGAWYATRENARRARETLSLELWEAINTAWHTWQREQERDSAGALAWARYRAAMIAGVTDSTMSHDDAWEFMVLGRHLERADMTARLVAAGALPIGLTWPRVLVGCGAQQAFLRSQSGVISDDLSASFLILDREFPRSVIKALLEAEQSLERLEPSTARLGFADEAKRRLGRIRTSLEYRTVNQVMTDLPHEMQRVQRTVVDASNAIAHRYFPSGAAAFWTEEKL